MWAVPNPCNVVLSNHRCPSNPELEQVVVLTLAGRDISQGLSLLHRLWTGDTTGTLPYINHSHNTAHVMKYISNA